LVLFFKKERLDFPGIHEAPHHLIDKSKLLERI